MIHFIVIPLHMIRTKSTKTSIACVMSGLVQTMAYIKVRTIETNKTASSPLHWRDIVAKSVRNNSREENWLAWLYANWTSSLPSWCNSLVIPIEVSSSDHERSSSPTFILLKSFTSKYLLSSELVQLLDSGTTSSNNQDIVDIDQQNNEITIVEFPRTYNDLSSTYNNLDPL